MAITSASTSITTADSAVSSQSVVVNTGTGITSYAGGGGAATIGASGPLITSIVVTDSDYNNLDDTAVGTSNSFIKIIGTGFATGANVFVGGTQVPSANVTFTSSTELRVALPVLTSGTNNTVSLFNSSGSGIIYASTLLVSGFPTVTTSSYIAESFTVNTQLLATGDGTLSYSLKSGSSLPAGLTLASTGLISGTVVGNSTTIFTVLVDDSQGQTTQQDITLVIAGTDLYYPYTALLLQADTTSNNSTNGTIIDSSNNSYTVTASGPPIQGTVNPFGTGTWSNYFDGTGDYLTTPATSAFGYSTGDFTIEFWMYLNSIAADVTILSNLSSGSGVQPHIYFGQNGSVIKYYTNSGDRITSGAISASTWYHVVICRSSGSTKMFINGTQAGSTYTDTNDYGASAPLGIGTYWNAGSPVGSSNFNGYISNARIVKGSALYTSTFTPSTAPLTAIANTQLLTCQSNNIKDNSTNALTLTPAGNATVERFNPFGLNNIGYEVSANTFAGSTYFDGSGDYLSFPSSSNLAFGSGDFTVEAWVYLQSTALQVIYCSGATSADNFFFSISPTGSFLGLGTKSVWILQGSVSLSLNTWYHVAVTRSGTTIRQYVNGTEVGTTTNNTNFLSDGTGSIGSNSQSGQYFTGYISNTRVIKGTALYTSSFTPSTVPLTAVTNTQLLTCQTSQSVVTDESTNKFTITASGTALATAKTPFTLTDTSTAGTTYSGSLYFDGSSYLSLGGVSGLALGAGNWTVELWAYHTSFATNGSVIYEGRPESTNGPYMVFGTNTNSFTLTVNNSNIISATPTLGANKWYHIAIVKNSGTITAYLNGVSIGSAADSTTFLTSGSAPYIGTNAFLIGNPNYSFKGYLSNLRVVIGTAVYTGAFTPPTAPAQPIANTALLLSGDNSGIYDAALKNSIQTIADAKVRTNVTKYGTGSIYLDGTGDYLSIPHTKDIDLSSGDFTIEAWVYWNSYVSGSAVVYKGNGAYGAYLIYVGGSNEVDFYTTITGTGWSVSGLRFTTSPTLGVWHHLAVTRSGDTYRTFFNGTLANSTTGSGTLLSQPTVPLLVGKYNTGSPFNGYIDDLRITKGYARYTANFTPPLMAMKSK